MKAILLLGSNLEQPINQLNIAIAHIAEIVLHYRPSSYFKTAAWGNTKQNDFINIALEVEFENSPEDLMQKLLAIERSMGRQRKEKWEPRIIDIDIITIESEIIETDELKVPHPYLQDRMFVLVPLNELNPDWIHPILKKNISLLIKECADNLNVEKIEA